MAPTMQSCTQSPNKILVMKKYCVNPVFIQMMTCGMTATCRLNFLILDSQNSPNLYTSSISSNLQCKKTRRNLKKVCCTPHTKLACLSSIAQNHVLLSTLLCLMLMLLYHNDSAQHVTSDQSEWLVDLATSEKYFCDAVRWRMSLYYRVYLFFNWQQCYFLNFQ